MAFILAEQDFFDLTPKPRVGDFTAPKKNAKRYLYKGEMKTVREVCRLEGLGGDLERRTVSNYMAQYKCDIEEAVIRAKQRTRRKII